MGAIANSVKGLHTLDSAHGLCQLKQERTDAIEHLK